MDKIFQRTLFLILAASSLLYICLDPQIRTGIFNDDAVYVIVAKDFWNTGLKHPLLGIKPDFPLPGLPLLLAPFTKFVSQDGFRLGLLSAIATILSIYIFALLIRRWMTPTETYLAILLYALNPVIARFSGIVMPGPYYALFVLLSFYLMIRVLEAPSILMALSLGFVLGWACFIRPEGVVLLFSMAVVLAGVSRGRSLLRIIGIPLVCWALFFSLWYISRKTPVTEFGSDVKALIHYWPLHLSSLLTMTFKLFQTYLIATWANMSIIFPRLTFYFCGVVGILWFLVSVRGYLLINKNAPDDRLLLKSIGIFCGLYLFIHVIWHVALPRYLIPIVPFAIVFSVRGVSELISYFRMRNVIAVMMSSLLFCSYMYENVHGVFQAQYSPRPMNAPPWRSLEWIQNNTLRDARITSNISASIDLYTERPSMGQVDALHVELFTYLLLKNKIEYIVIRDVGLVAPGVGATVNPNIMLARYKRWVKLYPEKFQSEFYGNSEKTGVYRVVFNRSFYDAYEKFIEAKQASNAGRYNQTFLKVNEALQLNPELGSAVNLMGALYAMNNNPSMAERYFMKASQLLPDSYYPLLNLATLHHQEGEEARTRVYIDKAIELSRACGIIQEFNVDKNELEASWYHNSALLYVY